jgi:hypothetical protein
MSFSLVWFAVQGIAADDFLERIGFEDTGEIDEYFEEEHSGGELPDGWYVVVSSKVELLASARLAQWSTGGRLIAALVHEPSANALATEWRDGAQVWSVSHDGSEGGDRLDVEGVLPEVFEELRQEAMAVSSSAEGDDPGEGVNLAFDMPLDLAAELTGFRHDELGFDDDITAFTALEYIRMAE